MYKINVLKTHIKKGQVNQPCQCPVALALLKAGFAFEEWDDGVDSKFFEGLAPDGQRVSIHLPKKVQEWIKRFDDGKSVKPITFTVKA